MDGWVTVVTKLDTKQLEKDLKKLEKELQKYEKEAERLTKRKLKLEIDNEKTLNDLTKVDNKIEIIDKKIKEMERVNLPENLSENIDYQKLLNQREELNNKGEEYLAKLQRIKAEQTEINTKTLENSTNQELVTQKIAETKRKLGGIDVDFSKIGKSINGVIKKVGRWALAVFGIRGAYMAVRNAINIIAQDDEKLASDIKYMKRALAYTIEPIVRSIVNLMQQLMNYVAYIVYAWTGRDIFESANKSLKNANSNAKKLSKTLAGFDEMNVLNDNGSTGVLGGMSTDLPTLKDVEAPSWIQWIANNKDLVISALGGIAAGLLNVKFGLDAISGTGVFLFFTGLIYTIMQLVEYFSNLDFSLENNGVSFQKFGNILVGIGLVIAAVALAIMSLPVAITGAVVVILGVLEGMWDEIKAGFQTLINWISTDVMDWLYEHFGLLGLTIGGIFQSVIESVMHLFDGLFIGIKQIFDGILLIFKGNFKQGFINIAKGIVNVVIGVLNNLISGLNAIISPTRALIVAIGKVMGKTWTMDNIKIPTIPKLAVGGIVNMPGRGIMYGGANIGERGAEGVIPLTNSQMMAQLGEAIGRYVTINANITNTMNGRIISRELQKVNNNSDFAFNR